MKKIRRNKKHIAQLRSINRDPVKDLPAKNTLKFPEQDPAVKWSADEEKERHKQWEKDATIAYTIYDKWKSKLINRRHTVGMILEAIDELKLELEEKITSDWKNYVINEILNPTMAHFHDQAIIRQFSQKAMVACPKCDWGAIAIFHKGMWDEGKCVMECPECKTVIKQSGHEYDQMVTEDEAKRIAAATAKAVKKGAKP